jgi:hypothetical protein
MFVVHIAKGKNIYVFMCPYITHYCFMCPHLQQHPIVMFMVLEKVKTSMLAHIYSPVNFCDQQKGSIGGGMHVVV